MEILPSRTCSAARPPSAMHVMSAICAVVISRFSLGRYCAKPSAALPRGTMLTCAHPALRWSACKKNANFCILVTEATIF